MTFKSLWQQLLPQYDAREAQAVVRLALETLFGFTLTDLYTGALDRLNPAQTQQLSALMHRLKHGEPVQYVLGKAWFCGRPFIVNPHVLIPRPETEQLCQRLISLSNQPYCALQPPAPRHGLDIGTGSGCIAITLALALDNVAMHAWDVSSDALLTARANAHYLGAQVDFMLQDALLAAENADNSPQYDFIVSNPPTFASANRPTWHHRCGPTNPQRHSLCPTISPCFSTKPSLNLPQNNSKATACWRLKSTHFMPMRSTPYYIKAPSTMSKSP